MIRKVFLIAMLAILLGGTSDAQSQRRQDGMVRVQLQIQMFITGPTDETDEANQQRERARKMLYDLAARECELMKTVIASDCRLEQVSVNFNRMGGPGQPQTGYMVMGSMSYQIALK